MFASSPYSYSYWRPGSQSNFATQQTHQKSLRSRRPNITEFLLVGVLVRLPSIGDPLWHVDSRVGVHQHGHDRCGFHPLRCVGKPQHPAFTIHQTSRAG